MITPATRMYQQIKSGEFNQKPREQIMEELGITYGQYYYLLRCLKGFGLIRKSSNGYSTNSDFAERLKRLAEYAEE